LESKDTKLRLKKKITNYLYREMFGISGFRRGVNEILTLLGCYAA
jgi:hypothetical protein